MITVTICTARAADPVAFRSFTDRDAALAFIVAQTSEVTSYQEVWATEDKIEIQAFTSVEILTVTIACLHNDPVEKEMVRDLAAGLFPRAPWTYNNEDISPELLADLRQRQEHFRKVTQGHPITTATGAHPYLAAFAFAAGLRGNIDRAVSAKFNDPGELLALAEMARRDGTSLARAYCELNR